MPKIWQQAAKDCWHSFHSFLGLAYKKGLVRTVNEIAAHILAIYIIEGYHTSVSKITISKKSFELEKHNGVVMQRRHWVRFCLIPLPGPGLNQNPVTTRRMVLCSDCYTQTKTIYSTVLVQENSQFIRHPDK
jgi:hypothetical protein